MYSSVDTIWVLLGAVLVFFMQAGFAMVETGFTRAKNAGNIIMKNLMDFSLGTAAFWLLGFGLMFGLTSKGISLPFIGVPDFMVQGDYSGSYPTFAFLIFQTVFCATAATIVSGAMAERTKFISYCIYSVIISALIYPISGHWIWGGGWLSNLGFHDFAGSTAVHMVGGVAALIGAKFLGPRIGKFGPDGKPRAIPGHSLTLGALGVFILWFCWFGFNGGSTVSMTGDDTILSASKIFVTTNLAAAFASIATMILTWFRYKKPDVSMTLNGSLAGLVAITAGCDAVSPAGAAIIGIIAGVVVVFSVEFFEKVLKIDDPVGAISVHGVCGALGTLLTGLFAVDGGLFYGGGLSLLTVQAIGVGAVILWVSVTITIVFYLIKKTVGLRVTAAEEIAGLDIEEHGLVSSYADFMPVVNGFVAEESSALVVPQVTGATPVEQAVPVKTVSTGTGAAKKGGVKMTKIVIVSRQSKFTDLKKALNEIGVTGITVTHVMGCGMQKGRSEYYRGVPVDMTLLPKMQVETVVSKVPVRTVIEAAKKALYTGHIGDGKIFVFDVENVIKVRTGEEGYDALQDEVVAE
ncbi:ammonium transporter [Sphaerochaeta pleomorpha str. Grapes]|uniref:Ammonium transporter n=1 Tax=Sphaerochaeta pleomorpha (strain ATCC BAA-1885 / DSM 22778 / Grapes) TaxID=158190 RepID=G8QQ37_SPHPG|nr:ammonium transporter [Sphaerochaeta pleomorpha]AEV28614.1 ammonium transporter [Sphaerochaeta pleomorpha str. Grapes]